MLVSCEWEVAVHLERFIGALDCKAVSKQCTAKDGDDFDIAKCRHMALGVLILDEPADFVIQRGPQDVLSECRGVENEDQER